MIIGNNNQNPMNQKPNFTSNFETRFKTILEENKKNNGKINPFQEDNKAKLYNDPTNKTEMADKSFAMLQERLRKGLISLDEFNKQCQKLSNFRKED